MTQVNVNTALSRLGVPPQLSAIAIGGAWTAGSGDSLAVRSPGDGQGLAEFSQATVEQLPALVVWNAGRRTHRAAAQRSPSESAALYHPRHAVLRLNLGRSSPRI